MADQIQRSAAQYKSGAGCDPMHRLNYEVEKEALNLVVAFAMDARDLSLREEDFSMEPLRAVPASGRWLPKQHLNPFEAR